MARDNGVSAPLLLGVGVVGVGVLGLLIYRATRGPAAATAPTSSSTGPTVDPRSGGGRDVAQGSACAVIEVDDDGLSVDGSRMSVREAVAACRTEGPNARDARVELVFRTSPESVIGNALLLALTREQVAYSIRPGTLDNDEGRAELERLRREQSRSTFEQIFDQFTRRG